MFTSLLIHNAAQLSSAACMFNDVIVKIDYGGIAYGITHVLHHYV